MNTANKRASAIGIGLALRLVLPVPDGAIDQADRQQVSYSYAGILAGPLVPPPSTLRVRNLTVKASDALDMQVRVSSAKSASVEGSALVRLKVEP